MWSHRRFQQAEIRAMSHAPGMTRRECVVGNPKGSRHAQVSLSLITPCRTSEHAREPLRDPAGLGSGRIGRPFLYMVARSPDKERGQQLAG